MKKEDFSHITKPAPITLNEYQGAAMETRLETATPLYCLLNLPGEVGEVCGAIAKGIRDGIADHVEYRDKVRKELGDVLWHLAAVALDNGFLLEEIAAANLLKLKARKETGKLGGSGDDR